MTRGGVGGKEEQGKVMGPLFPRLHVSDAGKGGGPRAPPRNKMALYEQFTVPSSRFSSFAASTGSGHVPSTSASQVYGYDRPLFQPFNAPSNEPGHSSEKNNRNLLSQNSNSTRKESGRLSSQTKNNDVYAAKSAAECTSQHRVDITAKKYSGKKIVNDDEFMVPSICFPRFGQNSAQGHPRVEESSNSLCSTSPHTNRPATSKSSAKFDNAVNKHSEGINVFDMRSRTPLKAKDKEPEQRLRTIEVEECSTVQASKDRILNKDVKVSSSRDKPRLSNTNDSDKSHLGNNGHQDNCVNGNSIKVHSPTTRNAVSCKPSTNFDDTSQSSYLPEGSLNESGIKRKRSQMHQDTVENDDFSDSSMECIAGCEISPDDIVNAIGPKHFWKARRAIQNQQRIFAVQLFELHKLIKVQKIIAASPHLLIEGDPCLGSSLADKKNEQPKRNLKVQILSITNKDDTHPTLEQPELSKENTEANPPSPSLDNGLGVSHHDGAATDGAFTSNLPTAPAAPDNKQSNWCVNPPQNQWLVPFMSPSEGLVYKAYAGPCPPAGSLLMPFSPFYADCAPLRLPSAAYGVRMHHQPQHMAPPGAPPIPLNYNYFPPFSLPVMNPVAPVSAVEQGSDAAALQPNGRIEQQSRISSNMTHPGIWRFHASRESEAQGSCASSPFDRPQGDGSGPVLLFPAAAVENALPDQPSSGSHVIRVVPHNAHTASESVARIFRSIQMERQCNNS